MTEQEELVAFMDAVRADPDDDNVRLVYADYLQENGQTDRAEFIRVQVEIAKYGWHPTAGKSATWPDYGKYYDLKARELELWLGGAEKWFADMTKVLRLVQIGDDHPDEMTMLNRRERSVGYVRRGFIFEISLPWYDLVGAECRRCGGEGRIGQHWDPASDTMRGGKRCPECLVEQGKTPSRAPQIFTQPITRVLLSGREPDAIHARPGVRLWHRASSPGHMGDVLGDGSADGDRSYVPAPLFALLPPSLPSEHPGYEWVGESRAAAIEALSAACVKYGRAEFEESRRPK